VRGLEVYSIYHGFVSWYPEVSPIKQSGHELCHLETRMDARFMSSGGEVSVVFGICKKQSSQKQKTSDGSGGEHIYTHSPIYKYKYKYRYIATGRLDASIHAGLEVSFLVSMLLNR
jgi:hypothetical protein